MADSEGGVFRPPESVLCLSQGWPPSEGMPSSLSVLGPSTPATGGPTAATAAGITAALDESDTSGGGDRCASARHRTYCFIRLCILIRMAAARASAAAGPTPETDCHTGLCSHGEPIQYATGGVGTCHLKGDCCGASSFRSTAGFDSISVDIHTTTIAAS